MVRLLADQLKLSTSDDARATALALAVDKAVDQLPQHSYDYEIKSYMGKLRSLVFNIKRNEVRLCSGTARMMWGLTPSFSLFLAPLAWCSEPAD